MGITHALVADGDPLVTDTHWNDDHVGESLKWLATQAASSSATLDFTGWRDDTLYSEYIVEFQEVRPATAGAEFQMRISQDGGSTWRSTAGDYYYNSTRFNGATATAYNGGGSATAFGLAHNVESSLATLTVSGHIRIYPDGPSSPLQRWVIGQVHYLPQSSDRVFNMVNGDVEIGDFDGIRFLYSSGNITSGSIRLYGVHK